MCHRGCANGGQCVEPEVCQCVDPYVGLTCRENKQGASLIHSFFHSDCSLRLYLRSDIVYASITRGNKLKLVPQHCKYDLRKHYFTNRVVSIWNSLPNDVVMADNINLFKNHLDKFW